MRSDARGIALGIVFGWVGIQVIGFAWQILLAIAQFWIAGVVVGK